MNKIINYSSLEKKINEFSGKKKVLVGGCFDIFHYGHLQFLKKAKKAGDILIIALESDQFIRKFKKRQPIHSQKQRAEIIASLTMVDLVVLLPFFSSDKDYYNLVRKVKPTIIAVSEADQNLDKKVKQAKLIGAQVKTVINLIKNFSTTQIIRSFLKTL